MAEFLSTQLDLIFFFYGLAFILLGITCLSIARDGAQALPWSVLGAFGGLHGISEWLDLLALSIGDSLLFSITHTALMAGSFVLLVEFARLAAFRLHFAVPGRWVYVPLAVLIIASGVSLGVDSANAIARYTLGLTGASGTCLVFILLARILPANERRWALSAAAGFAVYGLLAAVIVPAAPFWPASVFNHEWFERVSGLPVQLVRGVVACSVAFSIWQLWSAQTLASTAGSPGYADHLRKQSVRTLAALITIFIAGCGLTQYLGTISHQNIQAEATSDLNLLADRLNAEASAVDSMVKVTARSAAVRTALATANAADYDRARVLLQDHVDAAGVTAAYLIDQTGNLVLAGGDAAANVLPTALHRRFRPSSGKPVNGPVDEPSDPALQAAIVDRVYYASYPVRDGQGQSLGRVVFEKSFAPLQADLETYEHPFFLLDAGGKVLLSNRPYTPRQELYGMTDGLWTVFQGEQVYLRAQTAVHGGFSLVLILTLSEIYASRFLGIVITLLALTLTLIHIAGTERLMRDNLQLSERLTLEVRARSLEVQAATDPLTGMCNRLKFDQALAAEIALAAEMNTIFCLVLYDVDHFKQVNDTYGHQAGDQTLVELSGIAADLIRQTDLLARWGGEEFIILVPNSATAQAARLAVRLGDAIRAHSFGFGRVTCSFGVAQYQPGDTAEALLARADQALYRAKRNGRDRVETAS